ncbi:hypothetical protein K438DRAFT_1974583 [Mycena galopus ATCC 62051]|nr:hypothetical protein K438DRAFT_1974583 [Mycena galopus ATCC 62051]
MEIPRYNSSGEFATGRPRNPHRRMLRHRSTCIKLDAVPVAARGSVGTDDNLLNNSAAQRTLDLHTSRLLQDPQRFLSSSTMTIRKCSALRRLFFDYAKSSGPIRMCTLSLVFRPECKCLQVTRLDLQGIPHLVQLAFAPAASSLARCSHTRTTQLLVDATTTLPSPWNARPNERIAAFPPPALTPSTTWLRHSPSSLTIVFAAPHLKNEPMFHEATVYPASQDLDAILTLLESRRAARILSSSMCVRSLRSPVALPKVLDDPTGRAARAAHHRHVDDRSAVGRPALLLWARAVSGASTPAERAPGAHQAAPSLGDPAVRASRPTTPAHSTFEAGCATRIDTEGCSPSVPSSWLPVPPSTLVPPSRRRALLPSKHPQRETPRGSCVAASLLDAAHTFVERRFGNTGIVLLSSGVIPYNRDTIRPCRSSHAASSLEAVFAPIEGKRAIRDLDPQGRPRSMRQCTEWATRNLLDWCCALRCRYHCRHDKRTPTSMLSALAPSKCSPPHSSGLSKPSPTQHALAAPSPSVHAALEAARACTEHMLAAARDCTAARSSSRLVSSSRRLRPARSSLLPRDYGHLPRNENKVRGAFHAFDGACLRFLSSEPVPAAADVADIDVPVLQSTPVPSREAASTAVEYAHAARCLRPVVHAPASSRCSATPLSACCVPRARARCRPSCCTALLQASTRCRSHDTVRVTAPSHVLLWGALGTPCCSRCHIVTLLDCCCPALLIRVIMLATVFTGELEARALVRTSRSSEHPHAVVLLEASLASPLSKRTRYPPHYLCPSRPPAPSLTPAPRRPHAPRSARRPATMCPHSTVGVDRPIHIDTDSRCPCPQERVLATAIREYLKSPTVPRFRARLEHLLPLHDVHISHPYGAHRPPTVHARASTANRHTQVQTWNSTQRTRAPAAPPSSTPTAVPHFRTQPPACRHLELTKLGTALLPAVECGATRAASLATHAFIVPGASLSIRFESPTVSMVEPDACGLTAVHLRTTRFDADSNKVPCAPAAALLEVLAARLASVSAMPTSGEQGKTLLTTHASAPL